MGFFRNLFHKTEQWADNEYNQAARWADNEYNQASRWIENEYANYIMSPAELTCYAQNNPDLAGLNPEQLQAHWYMIGAIEKRNNQCPSFQTHSGLYKGECPRRGPVELNRQSDGYMI